MGGQSWRTKNFGSAMVKRSSLDGEDMLTEEGDILGIHVIPVEPHRPRFPN